MKCKIWLPHRRPASYQTMSASKQATTARPKATAKVIRPSPASAPAAIRNKIAGTGNHICRANTEANRTEYPCFKRSWTIAFIAVLPAPPRLSHTPRTACLKPAASLCSCLFGQATLPNVAPVRSTLALTLELFGTSAHSSAAFGAYPVKNVGNDVFSFWQHCVRHLQPSSLNQTLVTRQCDLSLASP